MLSRGEVHYSTFSSVNDVIDTVPCALREEVRDYVIHMLTAQKNGEELIRIGVGEAAPWRAKK